LSGTKEQFSNNAARLTDSALGINR